MAPALARENERGRDQRRQPFPLLTPRPSQRPRLESLQTLLLRTWQGRLLIAGIALRVLVGVIESAIGGETATTGWLGTISRVALTIALAYFTFRFVVVLRRYFLWRVRQKLILSYVLVGVVPAILIIAFFVSGGWLLMTNISAYLFKTSIDEVIDEMSVMAQTTAEEIERSRVRQAPEILGRRFENNAERLPGLSIALVPWRHDTPVPDLGTGATITAGGWGHTAPPRDVPDWVSVGGFSGLLLFAAADDPNDMQLLVRAVGVPNQRDPRYAIVIDLPVDDQILGRLSESSGVESDGRIEITPSNDPTQPERGRLPNLESRLIARQSTGSGKWIVPSVASLDYTDWTTGRKGIAMTGTRAAIADIYERISSGRASVTSSLTFGQVSLIVLGVIAALLFIVQFVALVMGLTLARSITRSVHQLFTGTDRVMQGDFAHRIPITERDQLGELADSFNRMTASVEEALREAEEKRRLEEELRIAREIQMSLLPAGPFHMPGLAITALCIPAREVGGDYYDFFPLGDLRLGVIIADVAGKGTSAALYMAELKGLLLSLSRIHQSPKRLLIEVNRIISNHLDSRSFITMTYAVVDLEQRTLTYARAGHTPLIHLCCSNEGESAHADVLVPDGLVLGLRIDGVEAMFEDSLEECCVSFEIGDVFVLFTDGVTEAMNSESDLFGEDRFCHVIEQHGHLSSDELRERIMREVEAFVGVAEQHDDMTMILLKVEGVGATAVRPLREAVV